MSLKKDAWLAAEESAAGGEANTSRDGDAISPQEPAAGGTGPANSAVLNKPGAVKLPRETLQVRGHLAVTLTVQRPGTVPLSVLKAKQAEDLARRKGKAKGVRLEKTHSLTVEKAMAAMGDAGQEAEMEGEPDGEGGPDKSVGPDRLDPLVPLKQKYKICLTQNEATWAIGICRRAGLTKGDGKFAKTGLATLAREVALGTIDIRWAAENPPRGPSGGLEEGPRPVDVLVSFRDDEWDGLKWRLAHIQPTLSEAATDPRVEPIDFAAYIRGALLGVIRVPRMRGDAPRMTLTTVEEDRLLAVVDKAYSAFRECRLTAWPQCKDLLVLCNGVDSRVRVEGYRDPNGELAELEEKAKHLLTDCKTGRLLAHVIGYWQAKLKSLAGRWLLRQQRHAELVGILWQLDGVALREKHYRGESQREPSMMRKALRAMKERGIVQACWLSPLELTEFRKRVQAVVRASRAGRLPLAPNKADPLWDWVETLHQLGGDWADPEVEEYVATLPKLRAAGAKLALDEQVANLAKALLEDEPEQT